MEKIDLVYILGTGSRWGDNEIRYSLRSVEKYFPKAGRVFIIGECPDWATNVIHIKMEDKEQNKLLNARAKYFMAATNPQIGKEFVLMNDDFFFLKTVSKIPNFSRGKLQNMMDKHPTKGGYYYHSLADTKKRLDAMGIPDALDFEIHAPMIFNRSKLETVINMIGSDRAFSIRSCYGNLMGLKPEKIVDFKAANIAEFAYQRLRNERILSINDALVCNDDFRAWMRQKYPKMSKYETNDEGILDLPGRSIGKKRGTVVKRFEYKGRFYNTGDIIPPEIWKELKENASMRGSWKLD
jgi:hypothetical protein